MKVKFKIKEQNYNLRLPRKVVTDLIQSGHYRGILTVDVEKQESLETPPLDVQRERIVVRNYTRLIVEERLVLREWNRSDCVKAARAAKESRNYAIQPNEIIAAIPTIREALKHIDFEIIIQDMRKYFKSCERGDHIWEGVNHGFKNLLGFLKKIIESHKKQTRVWWDNAENLEFVMATRGQENRLATRIANSFAKTFLRQERYDFSVDSSAMRSFVVAADNLLRLIEKYKEKNVELTQRQVIEGLLECIDDYYVENGGKVTAKHLISPTLWASILPQHLHEKGVI